ncbi:hypothetical protein P3X46_018488 [Hevea brasiliensis]|uniref:MORF/ORRM1/DAG-like MORF domain-containing protein n=1 Tax=Hevea brasiliensis TaxID=3981 RepID=A0ABQ9LUW5_HEVBR|nr:hypothetical protein P3X46_018488 [Hevea brasiliensis]
MAQALARSFTCTTARRLTSFFLRPKRLLSSTTTITHPPSPSTLLVCRRSLLPLSHAVLLIKPAGLAQCTSIRCRHWLIVMDKPGGEGATEQQIIDCYIQTLAKVLGSEEEAKKKIYNVSCGRYFGFGCEIDEETVDKLEAELFVNGEMVQRPPERHRRVEPQPQRANDRPRYNDRTRYVRCRENMR